jgi:hypothetical protein
MMPCEEESLYVYDERGEKIAVVCSLAGLPGDGSYNLAISAYSANPGGGGTVTIYLNGAIIGTWDCRDHNGNLIPNSFYHFVLVARQPDGGEILLESDAYIAPHQGQAVYFVARPNLANRGDIILFSASVAGVPADERSKIRIFTVAGELVRTIEISNGTASWRLDTGDGNPVASGIYLAVLDGINPTNGQKLVKINKLLVRH